MDTELDDERPELREDDKTRQLVVPVRGAAIDDLSENPDTVASSLPAPDVTPFAALAPVLGGRVAPRAAPPPPRPSVDPSGPTTVSGTTPIDIATRQTNPSLAEAAARAMASIPKSPDGGVSPPLPPLPNAARASAPIEPLAHDSSRGESSPTIVVNEIVHQPSPRRLQREATVVVRRAVRRTKRSPMAIAVLVAVGIVGIALGYAGVRRYRENREREERIERRIEAIRRGEAG